VPAQVDAEGYGGSATGAWACGPTARATYGGAGGRARIHLTNGKDDGDEDSETVRREPVGASIGFGGGLESRGYERLSTCEPQPCTDPAVPRPRLLPAGHLNVGHDGRYWGLRAGVVSMAAWSESTDRLPTGYLLPDVDVRLGRRLGLHGAVGFGSYNVPTMFRPGAYAAVAYTEPERGWSVDFHAGPAMVFDNQVGFRGDLSLRYPFGIVEPGAGFAVSSVKELGPEGRLFVSFRP